MTWPTTSLQHLIGNTWNTIKYIKKPTHTPPPPTPTTPICVCKCVFNKVIWHDQPPPYNTSLKTHEHTMFIFKETNLSPPPNPQLLFVFVNVFSIWWYDTANPLSTKPHWKHMKHKQIYKETNIPSILQPPHITLLKTCSQTAPTPSSYLFIENTFKNTQTGLLLILSLLLSTSMSIFFSVAVFLA